MRRVFIAIVFVCFAVSAALAGNVSWMNDGIDRENGQRPVYFKMPNGWAEMGFRDDGVIVWRKVIVQRSDDRRNCDTLFLTISPPYIGSGYGRGLESFRLRLRVWNWRESCDE